MRARYKVLVAPRDFIARCLFRCKLLFQIWDDLFRVNGVLINFSRSRFRNCFLCCFWWIGLNTSLVDLLWMKSYIDASTILYRIHLGFKLKKRPFRVFRGSCQILSFFVKKGWFSVLVLNSVEVKDSGFISGEQCHLMVAISFLFRIQI